MVNPQVLLISSYPSRECGIANYTQDLVTALGKQFSQSFDVIVCALETNMEKHQYSDIVKVVLNTDAAESYTRLNKFVEANTQIKIILLQHEFGFFEAHETDLLRLVSTFTIPFITAFHTVLPNPSLTMKMHVQNLVRQSVSIIVMTRNAAHLLEQNYNTPAAKMNIIAHGTHLVQYLDKVSLKEQYGYQNRIVLSTFGLISRGKSIETTLAALPAIIKLHPTVLFLIIGKTHPTVFNHEGEQYRNELKQMIQTLNLTEHVAFINAYLPLQNLLEFLQFTDVYLFTSKDPNQAVSGTFSYALSCGCPIVSTPIPHALEVLQSDAGILVDFENKEQLAVAVNKLLSNELLASAIRSNAIHRMASTSWPNSAIAHALLFEQHIQYPFVLQYTLPTITLSHVQHLTTDFGMLQFSHMNHPDPHSGYTIDDNARALIAMLMHYEATGNVADLSYISVYLDFIQYCIKPTGRFLNYVNYDQTFSKQNDEVNLDDSNGRAFWALGFLISKKELLPEKYVTIAKNLLHASMASIGKMHSTRAIAFSLKGLYYYHTALPSIQNVQMATKMATKLERMYMHESENGWLWYEGYLTYANSILPEGLLCAYSITGNENFKAIALSSFDFLLANTFTVSNIKLISNKGWKYKGQVTSAFGEQPIDVAYTILALARFYEVFEDKTYIDKMQLAFNWFLGSNHLHQIMYNPLTGGCYDGLEENHVNLNQGAESTLSYLMSRLTLIETTQSSNYASEYLTEQHGVGAEISE